MKFRTDFVTNSSSSSFVAVRLTTRDGQASSRFIDELDLTEDAGQFLEGRLCRKDGELFYQDKPLHTSADLAGALLHLISSDELGRSPYRPESLCAAAAFAQNALEPQALLEVLAKDPAFSILAGTEPTREAVEQALSGVDNLLFGRYLGALPQLTALCTDTVPTLDELGAVAIHIGGEYWGESEEGEDKDFGSDDTVPGMELCSFDLFS